MVSHTAGPRRRRGLPEVRHRAAPSTTSSASRPSRSDLSISVGELGSLLDHSGPIRRGRAQRGAHLQRRHDAVLVTNGTSTSNRVVHLGHRRGRPTWSSMTATRTSLWSRPTPSRHVNPVYMIPFAQPLRDHRPHPTERDEAKRRSPPRSRPSPLAAGRRQAGDSPW